MGNIIRERRMRWNGHVLRMDQESITAVRRTPPNGKENLIAQKLIGCKQ